jgi:spore germination cell wall hydrolase CwlJ-like protein
LRWPVTLLAVAALTLGGGLAIWRLKLSPDHGDDAEKKEVTRDVAALPAPDLVRSITSKNAVIVNSKRPFAQREDSPAAPFRYATSQLADKDRALKCLTQAVYYEAEGEGQDGRRAIAQVVLNRVRHPGFPPTICGVVYQGSERITGCQFTFTCDGSLRRDPAPAVWLQAKRVAAEALSGRVFAEVGHATHYHADYVLPYWADSLDKTTRIGRHLFYRLRALLGSSRAFSQVYAGKEPEPPSQIQIKSVAEIVNATIASQGDSKSISGQLAPPPATGQPNVPLLADTSQGVLIMDGGAAAARSRISHVSECRRAEDSKQAKPLAVNDLRLNKPGSGC